MAKQPTSAAAMIRAARQAAGLTQAGLAAALDKRQATVSDWETGRKTPEMGTLLRLAELAGRSIVISGGDWHLVPVEAAEEVVRRYEAVPAMTVDR